MGNIQNYCGDQCSGKDELMQRSEQTFAKPRYVINDQQEYCLRKVVNAWKRYKIFKNIANSNTKLKILLKKLDETIKEEKGEFILQTEFERQMHPVIYVQYQRLAQAELSTGFKSLQDPKGFRNKDFNEHSHNVTLNELDIENLLVLRKPVFMRDSGEIYFGFWNLKGEKQGYAKIIRNGLLAEGDWTSGGKCANGRLFYTNGSYFQGKIDQYVPNEKGILSNFDECFYTGEWLNGEYDGIGTLRISKLCRYEGNFRNSALHGKGKLIYESYEGLSYNYNGEFEDNKFSGFGNLQYFAAKGRNPEELTGNWRNGIPNGRGTYIWSNGSKYEGNYEDGKKRGQGKYTFNYGKSYYEGSWSNGKPNGKGILVLDSEKGSVKISGIWKLGKAQKIDTEEEFKKINEDESKLNILVDSEIFSNEYSINIEYVTTTKPDITKIFNDIENGNLHYTQVLSKQFYKGVFNFLEKQKVFSYNNVLNGKQ